MAHDKWIKRGAAEYAQGLNNLLPTGAAWPRDADAVLQKVVTGLSEIWGDTVEELAALLLTQESDPRTTIALLPEWERAFGLPDKCLAEPLTIPDRQAALVARMTTEGGQSRAFFIAAAAKIGYSITITEYAPFMVGVSQVGDHYDTNGLPRWQIGAPEIRFYWSVRVSHARLSWFRAGSGEAGIDPHLRIALATDLECLLRRYKPAHTEIVFNYSNLELGDPMSGTP